MEPGCCEEPCEPLDTPCKQLNTPITIRGPNTLAWRVVAQEEEEGGTEYGGTEGRANLAPNRKGEEGRGSDKTET